MRIFVVFLCLIAATVFVFAESPDMTILGTSDQKVEEQQKGYEGYALKYQLSSDGKYSINVAQPESEEELPPQPAVVPQVPDPAPEPATPPPDVDPYIGWEIHYNTPSGLQTIYQSIAEFGADFRKEPAVPAGWTYRNSNPVRESGARE
ncbi:MAG: hypothetical protein KKB51_21770 [Candidatus Riflebacteria bacterium]|nr:hypothetical protein [Candidatus Riflebacteria bacterium]